MSSEYRVFSSEGSPMRAAIANTLSFLDDEVAAEEIFAGFDTHRLVRPDRSILLPFVPTLVRELTRDDYRATLYAVVEIPFLTRQIVAHYDGQTSALADLVTSEIRSRNIVSLPINHSLDLDPTVVPSICVFKTLNGAAPLVYLGDQVPIDDQVCDQVFVAGDVIVQLDPMSYPTIGMIKIEENY